MPIFQLTDQLIFPDPSMADASGILAVGGDLSPERLQLAYEHGIFPWFSEDEPIIWWSPDPRFVLYTNKVHVSTTMRRILRQGRFRLTVDTAFEEVIKNCKQKERKGQEGTWITKGMQQAYTQLHHIGIAHSVEVWQEEKLVGGMYGVSLGDCFFGESMFSHVSNASKAALIVLGQKLQQLGFRFIDCQVYTKHLKSMGAENIPRDQFLNEIKEGLKKKTLKGNWSQLPEFKDFE